MAIFKQLLRGVSDTTGLDPDSAASVNNGADGKRFAKYNGGNVGNAVGSYQLDTLKSHKHDAVFSNGPNGVTAVTNPGPGPFQATRSDVVQPYGGNETRPKNAYVIYLIKY